MTNASAPKEERLETASSHTPSALTYLVKRSHAVRTVKALERELAEPLVISKLYCPGEPKNGHDHDLYELRDAVEKPQGLFLSCKVTYSRIMREMQKAKEKAALSVMDSKEV